MRLEAIAQAAIGAFFEPFEGERSPGAIAAEQFEAVAVALVDVRVGVKGEAFEGSTAALAGRWTLVGGEGKATLESRGLECLQGIVGVGLLVQTSTAGEQADQCVKPTGLSVEPQSLKAERCRSER